MTTGKTFYYNCDQDLTFIKRIVTRNFPDGKQIFKFSHTGLLLDISGTDGPEKNPIIDALRLLFLDPLVDVPANDCCVDVKLRNRQGKVGRFRRVISNKLSKLYLEYKHVHYNVYKDELKKFGINADELNLIIKRKPEHSGPNNDAGINALIEHYMEGPTQMAAERELETINYRIGNAELNHEVHLKLLEQKDKIRKRLVDLLNERRALVHDVVLGVPIRANKFIRMVLGNQIPKFLLDLDRNTEFLTLRIINGTRGGAFYDILPDSDKELIELALRLGFLTTKGGKFLIIENLGANMDAAMGAKVVKALKKISSQWNFQIFATINNEHIKKEFAAVKELSQT